MRAVLFFLVFLFLPALSLGFAGLPDIPETPPALTIPVPEPPPPEPGAAGGGVGGGLGGLGLPGLVNGTVEEEEGDGDAGSSIVPGSPASGADVPALPGGGSLPTEGGDALAGEGDVSRSPLPSGVILAIGVAALVIVLLVVIVVVVRGHRRRSLPSNIKKF